MIQILISLRILYTFNRLGRAGIRTASFDVFSPEVSRKIWTLSSPPIGIELTHKIKPLIETPAVMLINSL